MDSYQYLIIGGGIAGVTAAETIREQDPDATIGIVSHEAYPLYSRVLLPSHLKRKIPREKLFLRTGDDFIANRIELRLQETVTAIDAKRREVTLRNGATLGYAKLLIASGGRVKPWGRPEDESVIYRLQTLDDADRLFDALGSIKNPLVIGSSFISLEFLEIFLLNGLTPGLLMRDEHFFASYLEKIGGELMRAHFQRHHITLYEHDEVAQVRRAAPGSSQIGTQEGRARIDLTVLTKKQQVIPCDALAVGVGIERNLAFIDRSNILRGNVGIRVNEFLETGQESIYAAGDVAEVLDPVTGTYRATGNWTSAFLEGKHAGLNMSGMRVPFTNIPSYSITNLGMQITVVGECLPTADLPKGDADTIVRVDTDKNEYERLFLVEGSLRGAVLINRFKDRAHLIRLIETHQKLDAYQDRLSSFQFDITTIPVI
ncbi:MAG: FAD-dependent oxidoreductase [Candidatus Sungbacteria bacterium]|nr:FAD-dependent oxidoreductase [Candidatus Sungbacteria bacterium]